MAFVMAKWPVHNSRIQRIVKSEITCIVRYYLCIAVHYKRFCYNIPVRFILCWFAGGLESIPASRVTGEGLPERMASPSQDSQTFTPTVNL